MSAKQQRQAMNTGLSDSEIQAFRPVTGWLHPPSPTPKARLPCQPRPRWCGEGCRSSRLDSSLQLPYCPQSGVQWWRTWAFTQFPKAPHCPWGKAGWAWHILLPPLHLWAWDMLFPLPGPCVTSIVSGLTSSNSRPHTFLIETYQKKHISYPNPSTLSQYIERQIYIYKLKLTFTKQYFLNVMFYIALLYFTKK